MYKIKYRAILGCSNYPRDVSGFSAGINVLANTIKKMFKFNWKMNLKKKFKLIYWFNVPRLIFKLIRYIDYKLYFDKYKNK